MNNASAKGKIKVHNPLSGRYTPHNPSPQPKLTAKKARYTTPTALSPKIYKFKRVKNEGMFI